MGDVIGDMDAPRDGSRLVLAHRRVDVAELNDAIRTVRQGRGELRDEHLYQTTEGERAFAAGDRLLFRENNRDLGVKNGMLGTVERAEPGRLEVRLDNASGPGQGRRVSVSMANYAAVDHGYATTIHKAQGATAMAGHADVGQMPIHRRVTVLVFQTLAGTDYVDEALMIECHPTYCHSRDGFQRNPQSISHTFSSSPAA